MGVDCRLALIGTAGWNDTMQKALNDNGMRGSRACRVHGRRMMKKILAVIALSSSALFVQACNTIDGAVDDVESVGDCVDGVEGNC